MQKREKNKEKTINIYDNCVRRGHFAAIADERTALICFVVEVMPDVAFVNMNVRLRGIVPRRNIECMDGGTFDIIRTELSGEDLTLRFYPRPERY